MPEEKIKAPLVRIFAGPQGARAGWRALLFVVLTLLIAIPMVLAMYWLHLAPHPAGALIPPATVFMGEGIFLPAALLAAWLLSRIERRAWRGYIAPVTANFGRNFRVGAFWGLAAMSALLGGLRLAGVYSFGALSAHGAEIAYYALVWAAAFLLVAGFEEFFFRGYLLYTFATGMGFWPAALLSSFFFGAIHLGNRGEDIVGALSAGLAGLFFAFTVRRTGNLGFALGVHAGWDYAESFIYGVPDSGARSTGALLHPGIHGPAWLTGGGVGPEGSLLVFVILGALFLVFHRTYPAIRYPELKSRATAPSPAPPPEPA